LGESVSMIGPLVTSPDGWEEIWAAAYSGVFPFLRESEWSEWDHFRNAARPAWSDASKLRRLQVELLVFYGTLKRLSDRAVGAAASAGDLRNVAERLIVSSFLIAALIVALSARLSALKTRQPANVATAEGPAAA